VFVPDLVMTLMMAPAERPTGGEGVGLDVDFLNGVDGGPHSDGADDALVVVHAVDELVVDDVCLAIDGDGGGLTAIVGTVALARPLLSPSVAPGTTCTRLM